MGLAVMGGRTPLYWARDGGHREVEALLRQHGTECPLRAPTTTPTGATSTTTLMSQASAAGSSIVRLALL